MEVRRVAPLGWAVIVVLVLVPQELLFRWAFPLPDVVNFNRMRYTLDAGPATRGELRNARLVWPSEPDRVAPVETTNLYGFRGPTWNARPPAGTARVMIVGDSVVEGAVSEDDATIPLAFQERSEQRGVPVEALNLGVGGAQLPEYVSLVRDGLPVLRPDALVLVLFANDFPFPRWDPAWLADPLVPRPARRWTPRAFEVVAAALAGRPAPRRWYGRPVNVFAAVPDPSNPWTVFGKGAERIAAPALADAMRRGTFNPFLVNVLEHMRHDLPIATDVRTPLAALAGYAAGRKVPFALAYVPFSVQVSDYYVSFERTYSDAPPDSLRGPEYQLHARLVAAACADLGLPFLDLTPLLRAEEDAGHHLYWDYDIHLRPEGYRFVGRTLFDWWQGWAHRT